VSEILPLAQARRIDIGVAASAPLHVHGQPEALHVLLRNLLDNALKYSPEGGQVDLSLEGADGAAQLIVEDSGPGIPEAERARVFDRFYRVSQADSTAAATGSGLGLAIVKAIAARHGAVIQLGSSPRLGGLRAEVRFPVSA
jgi:two-component system, OmpR family, sensor kinase